jgi:hypothetical protein
MPPKKKVEKVEVPQVAVIPSVLPTNPEEEKVRAWLKEMGLQQYGCDFIENGWDSRRRLHLITSEHLELMKITKIGHVSDILNQVRKLNALDEGNVLNRTRSQNLVTLI